jgi:hypothetical protein
MSRSTYPNEQNLPSPIGRGVGGEGLFLEEKSMARFFAYPLSQWRRAALGSILAVMLLVLIVEVW